MARIRIRRAGRKTPSRTPMGRIRPKAAGRHGRGVRYGLSYKI